MVPNLRKTSSRLVVAAALSLALCGFAAAQAKPSNPTLISFSPTQGTPGSTVTLIFTGTNFAARSMNLIFTPSQGLTVTKLQVISSSQISAQVQIDASAQTGNRQVMLIDADHNLPASMPFTIAVSQQNCTFAVNGACQPTGPKGNPALKEFSPLQGTQGSTVTLTLTGVNFSSPASLQFTPNSGLTVQSTTVTNANQIQAVVNIAPGASLGPRGVALVQGPSRLPASNTFTVVSGINLRLPPMQILRVVPNQIPAGSQNVDLTLQGVNFVPGTQVTFTVGAGVPAAVFAAGPARYVNSTELHVTVSALPSALPGGRDVNLQTPSQQSVVGKGMLNVQAVKTAGLPTVLKIPPITLQSFPMGVIKLDGPVGVGQCVADSGCTYAIPLLDDDAVFKWHEQNPGLADYYELRIYAKDGKTLLHTQRITGIVILAMGGNGSVRNVPTYYRPDAAFLSAVLNPPKSLVPIISLANTPSRFNSTQPSTGNKPVLSVNSSVISRTGVAMGSVPAPDPNDPSSQLANGDLQFEVAGFHTFNKNGVATQQNPQANAKSSQGAPLQNVNSQQNASAQQNAPPNQTVDLEVEISNRWPLKAPLAPTGLACSGTGFGNGLQVTNVADKKIYGANGKPTGGIDPNDYIGDPWVLSGTFSLNGSPFATHPTFHDLPGSKCQGCMFGTIDQVQFDNLFVDWGDGSVSRLNVPPATSGSTSWDPSQPLSLPTNATSPYAVQHAYQYPGSYTVRVFQLSEADAQHVNISLVAASVDGPANPFLQAAVLTKIAAPGGLKGGLTQTSVQSGLQAIMGQGSGGSGSQGPSPAQVASDAFMIFCHTINVTVPEDLDADGPLHLKSIDDPDFPGYDVHKPIERGLGLKQTALGQAAGNQSSGIQASPALKPTEHPTDLAAGEQNEKQSVSLAPLRPGEAQPAAICSACDDGMLAQSYLHYYGKGEVRVTWIVDGAQSQQTMALPASQARTNLTRPKPGEAEPPIIISTSDPLNSLGLQVQPIGMHNVAVEADVAPEPTMPNLSATVGRTLRAVTLGGGASKGQTLDASAAASQAQSLLNTLAPPAGSKLPPLKVGVLSPSNQSAGGMGAVQYVNGSLQQIASLLANLPPDQHVASNTKVYQVVAADPSKACKFLFPVKSGGGFEISGLQNNVVKNGTKYTGTGNLIIHLANNSSGGYDQYPPIPVKINNWDVPDGLNVQTGSIDVSPNLTLAASVPGLKGTVDRLQGQAGAELDATLSVTLSDETLRLPGLEKPQTWSGVTAELKSSGDWLKDGLTLPSTLIGWSAFTMQSSTVRLDLSHHDGDAAGLLCGPLSGGDWVGVRFAQLAITPYTMDLVSSSALQPIVTDWGIVGSGLCGNLSTGPAPFTASLGAGSITIASINATAFNGTFNAQYKGMDVYVPWLDTHLKGDATLQSGGGKQASISFPFTASPVSKTYGNFAFTASNLQFTQQQNIGWVVQADTHFVFSAENRQFAAFDRPFFFGMDGRGYFASGSQAADISLGGSSHLAQTPVDLVSAHITLPPTGNQIIGIQFNTNVHLSEVMAAAPMQVNYEVDKTGANYSTSGPESSPFSIDVPYPSGQPSSEAKVHPVYSGGSNSEYSGSVDLSEIGGPAITGEFRLGYQGGHDYWLTRVGVTLPSGVPVAPDLSLFKVQGGMGHNFPISAFEHVGTLSGETPTMDGSFLFMAGMRIGTSDEFTCTVEGDLTIEAGGSNAGARMDFHSWILKQADNSNGDFSGYFQYAGSNFDGRMWGHLNFMNNAAYVDLGSGPNDAAIDFHFGPSGPWHIDFGKQQGPRIHGHLLVSDADMYMMLSSSSLSLGGGEYFDLEAGAGGISGYIKGGMDVGLTVTSQPHISGDFSASVEAGACVSVSVPLDGSITGCVHVGVSAQVHAEFAPLDVHASATVGTPIGDVTVNVHL
ncbi:MAG: hypothetical protein ACLQBK_05665 [Candidatus Sulfotelmatobacter sp.]